MVVIGEEISFSMTSGWDLGVSTSPIVLAVVGETGFYATIYEGDSEVKLSLEASSASVEEGPTSS